MKELITLKGSSIVALQPCKIWECGNIAEQLNTAFWVIMGSAGLEFMHSSADLLKSVGSRETESSACDETFNLPIIQKASPAGFELSKTQKMHLEQTF